MEICIVGTGYVGLVAAACFAETGNVVRGADIDRVKIDLLNQGGVPIYEPGLQELIARNRKADRLSFTADVGGAIAKSSVVVIAVGTPPDEDGSADLRHVLSVAESIGEHMARETVVINKSTVPVGTGTLVQQAVARKARFPFHVVSNPEFLKEGAALDDFMKPDRVVVGADSEYGRSVMADLYSPFTRTGHPVLFMDVRSAEMTKYAANAMLATRISFMNDIANLCERIGANVDQVRIGIGSDSRIGAAFLFPGPGYGGSCFPKDVKALVQTGEDRGVSLDILKAVEAANERQKRRLFEKLQRQLGGVRGQTIGVWGLAFKAETDDVRESPALVLVEALLQEGAAVRVHDPAAMETARRDRRGWWALAHKPETDDGRHPPPLRLVEALLQEGAAVRVHDPAAMETAR